ncbi:hypothetical protein AXG93_1293s1000 [Marchantia polymorpha subsp. ruderalis]|uniref:Uncharacterized protein n=1 Tax=Marchantia polymorpha subsp. ruderalis TaxID=1480154 RepID=A0A176WE82_MARPO|nr:hypothetical protein AXG93_1293s1000 [Marchantia polymorpha subsp. ruderalis]
MLPCCIDGKPQKPALALALAWAGPPTLLTFVSGESGDEDLPLTTSGGAVVENIIARLMRRGGRADHGWDCWGPAKYAKPVNRELWISAQSLGESTTAGLALYDDDDDEICAAASVAVPQSDSRP